MYSPSIQKLIEIFSKFPTVGSRTASRFVFYLLGLQKEEIEELTSAISNLKENVKLCKFCYKSFETEPRIQRGEEDLSSLTTRAAAKGEKEDLSSLTKEGEFCEICKNPRRDKSLMCLVEKETDLIPIEKTKKYQGLYFILGGTVSALKKDYNPPTTRGAQTKVWEGGGRVGVPSKGRAPELKKFTPLNSAEGNLTRLRIQELLERVKNPEIKEIIIALNPTTEGEAIALYLERTLKPLGKKTTRLGRGLPFGGELEYADEETLSSALEGRK